MYLSAARRQTLATLLSNLQEFTDSTELRREIGPPLLQLLNADQYISYVYDPARQQFTNDLSPTLAPGTLQAYRDYYVAFDCVTPVMARLNRPAIVEREVGVQTLRSSTFFNEFLRMERMTSGINLYLRDQHSELGDIRLWRESHRPAFDDADLRWLELLQPALNAALRGCRDRVAPQATPASRRACKAGVHTEAPRWHEAQLSQREAEVARMAAAGLPDKQIARELQISFTTVRTHLGNIYRKLGVANRVALASRLSSAGEPV